MQDKIARLTAEFATARSAPVGAGKDRNTAILQERARIERQPLMGRRLRYHAQAS